MNKLSLKDAIDVIGLVAILLGLFFVYREIELNATVARAQLSAETNQNLFTLDQMLIDGSLSHAFRLAANAITKISDFSASANPWRVQLPLNTSAAGTDVHFGIPSGAG